MQGETGKAAGSDVKDSGEAGPAESSSLLPGKGEKDDKGGKAGKQTLSDLTCEKLGAPLRGDVDPALVLPKLVPSLNLPRVLGAIQCAKTVLDRAVGSFPAGCSCSPPAGSSLASCSQHYFVPLCA